MVLEVSLSCILVATLSVYLTKKIKDEVFQVGMTFVTLVCALVILFCAPWLLKLFVVALPLLFGNINTLSS